MGLLGGVVIRPKEEMWDRDRSAHDDAVLGVKIAEAAEQKEREPGLRMAGTLIAS